MDTYYCVKAYKRKIKDKNKYYKILRWDPLVKQWKSYHGGKMAWTPGSEHKLVAGPRNTLCKVVMCEVGLHATNDPWFWSDSVYGWTMGLFEVTSIGAFKKNWDKIVTAKMTIGPKPLMKWTHTARPRDVFKRMRKLGIYE